MVAAHERMLAAIRERKTEGVAGNVAAGEPETDTYYYTAAAAAAVNAGHPGVQFYSFTGNTRAIVERLHDGTLDFGIVNGPFRSQEFHGLPIRHETRWGVLVRKGSPDFRGKTELRLSDLKKTPLAIPAPDGVNEAFRNWYATERPAFRCVGTYSVDARAMMLVESGLCHALCTDKRIFGLPRSPFRFLPLVPARPARFVMLWRRGKTLSPACELFLAQMRRLAPKSLEEVCRELEKSR